MNLPYPIAVVTNTAIRRSPVVETAILGDNPKMLNTGSIHRYLVVLLPILLTACGYAVWPPPTDVPPDINRSRQDDPAFVGASAVIVGKGDTVYALSRRHRVPVRAIIDQNSLQPPFILQVGQRIVLPRGKQYRVQRGDTLVKIALENNVDSYDIASLNGLQPPYLIQVGQILTIPSSAPDRTRTVAVSPNVDSPSPAQKEVLRQSPTVVKAPVWSVPPKMTSVQPDPPKVSPPARVPPPPAPSGGGFIWPVKGRVISAFGAKSKGLRNDGVNIQAGRGTPVLAAENGVVAYAGNELRGFGNLLLVRHAGGWVTAYAHNDRLLVRRGQKLRRGQKIATVGSTGNVTSPQLHFEIRKGKIAQDPTRQLGRS